MRWTVPGRRNVVITRQAGYAAAGAEVVRSLPQALAEPETWVIGGAEIYRLAMPLADRCEVTEVDVDLHVRDGGALAPVLGGEWSAEVGEWQVSGDGLRWRAVSYRR